MSTPFAIGRRWSCQENPGRARFWFVIIGPGTNRNDKPAASYKRCRIEVHPDDITSQRPGYKTDGLESTYSHKHLKKHAVLEPVETNTLAGWSAIIEEQGRRDDEARGRG